MAQALSTIILILFHQRTHAQPKGKEKISGLRKFAHPDPPVPSKQIMVHPQVQKAHVHVK